MTIWVECGSASSVRGCVTTDSNDTAVLKVCYDSVVAKEWSVVMVVDRPLNSPFEVWSVYDCCSSCRVDSLGWVLCKEGLRITYSDGFHVGRGPDHVIGECVGLTDSSV